MPELTVVPIELTEEQETALKAYLREEIGQARTIHEEREKKLARLKKAYKAKPEHDVKNFPWPNCSNIVIPIVAITVDNIVARLMKAFLGTPDLLEVKILMKDLEILEKDVRDWGNLFFSKSGARDAARTIFHDMAVDGDAFVKVLWVSKDRTIHAYGADGQVYAQLKKQYEGPTWHAVPKADMLWPEGFDDWKKLPWIAERLRYTWVEIRQLVDVGFLRDSVLTELKPSQAAQRQDERYRQQQESNRMPAESQARFFEMYEIWGKFEVPPQPGKDLEGRKPDEEGLVIDDCILIYDYQHDVLCRAIYNPYFSKPTYIVRIPYLVQPHEAEAMGVAEMAEPFQAEASTAHNQVIDAATAGIAGIVVQKAGANFQPNQDIYPGARIVVDDVDDIEVIHLSQGNSTLPDAAVAAGTWSEKRTGVSVYNMGMESPTVGSRATATGTTALISEGNQRFWVSIDDMREALEELFYLTIGLEQQMRPEGTPISEGKLLTWPQGDARETLGLTLSITSEKVNRDLEIQNFQLLITVLNDYYAKLMQFGGMMLNPQFPPQQKQLAMQVMTAAQNLVKRFVERFDVENIDELVPAISQATDMLGGMLGPGQMAGNTGGLPPGLPGPPGAGAPTPPVPPVPGM